MLRGISPAPAEQLIISVWASSSSQHPRAAPSAMRWCSSSSPHGSSISSRGKQWATPGSFRQHYLVQRRRPPHASRNFGSASGAVHHLLRGRAGSNCLFLIVFVAAAACSSFGRRSLYWNPRGLEYKDVGIPRAPSTTLQGHGHPSSASHGPARPWACLERQPRPGKDMGIPRALATTLQGHGHPSSPSHDPARTCAFLER